LSGVEHHLGAGRGVNAALDFLEALLLHGAAQRRAEVLGLLEDVSLKRGRRCREARGAGLLDDGDDPVDLAAGPPRRLGGMPFFAPLRVVRDLVRDVV